MKFVRAIMATLVISGLVLGASAVVPSTTRASDTASAIDAASIDVEGDEQSDSTQDASDSSTPITGPSQSVEARATGEELLGPNAAQDSDLSESQVFDVTYIDDCCTEQTAEVREPISAQRSSLTTGWYVLREDVVFSQELSIEGDVNIVLAGGHTLTVNGGIRVKKDAALTLYGEKDHPGKLVVHKGVTRALTPEEQEEEDAWLAQEREADPEFTYEEPQILFVWPCLSVTAGDHAPWPKDAEEPDPDPDHAPKRVKMPELTKDLLGKKYLCIQPRLEHTLRKDGDNFLMEDGHYTCTACGCWLEDIDGKVRLDKTSVMQSLAAQGVAESESEGTSGEAAKVTITFDPNGGSGSMDPMVVRSGEGFVLPECTFAAPEGMEFGYWSLGKPGSTVSVPTNTTVRAWWKKSSSPDSGSTSSTSDVTSSTDESSSDGASSATSAANNNEQSSTGASASGQGAGTGGQGTANGDSPKTGDGLASLSALAVTLGLLGFASVMAGKQAQNMGAGASNKTDQ